MLKSKGWIALGLIAGALLGGGALALALDAEPGSKEDPLATVGYVQHYAQFTRVELSQGQSLRLAGGAEFVAVTDTEAALPVRELDLRKDTVVDLTAGAMLLNPELQPQHLYVNASNHDIFVKLDRAALVLVRGEWK